MMPPGSSTPRRATPAASGPPAHRRHTHHTVPWCDCACGPVCVGCHQKPGSQPATAARCPPLAAAQPKNTAQITARSQPHHSQAATAMITAARSQLPGHSPDRSPDLTPPLNTPLSSRRVSVEPLRRGSGSSDRTSSQAAHMVHPPTRQLGLELRRQLGPRGGVLVQRGAPFSGARPEHRGLCVDLAVGLHYA